MSTTLNWAALVAKNRVKAPGVPWSPKEHEAVFKNKVDPEIVRSGFLTVEAFEKAKAEAAQESDPYSPKKLKVMKKADLVATAKKLGLDLDWDGITKSVIEGEIISAVEAGADKEKS